MNETPSRTAPNSQMNRSDEELWTDYVNGSDAAFDQIRARYRSDIFRYLLLSGMPIRDSAQMLGQIFCFLAAHREEPRGFDSIREWIFAVTTQQFVPAHSPDEPGLIGFISEMQDGRPTTRVERARRDLDDMQRDVRQPFLLVAVFDLTIEEAARACRFPPDKTAKKVDLAFRRLAASESLIQEQT